jgi:transketolase
MPILNLRSHAGVSIGEDGPSQMGLEDLAMFRTIGSSVVFYPADAIATERLVAKIQYTRELFILELPGEPHPSYSPEEEFTGGCKICARVQKDAVTVIGAGVTIFSPHAHEELAKEGINIRA